VNCPSCNTDSVSFWRVWLLNLRQRVSCNNCQTDLRIEAPGKIALGTFVLLLGSGAAYVSPGSQGLGLALMLYTLIANFVLTHHYVELYAPEDREQRDQDEEG